MKCLECNVEMKVVHENHKYLECGLDNVVIVNATKHKCAQCGEEYLDLPNPEGLHSALSEAIIRNSKALSGAEFRFLRQHLGFSGAYLAKIVNVSRETISRYENGKLKIPRTLDLLIKSWALDKLPSRDYDYHDLILEDGRAATRAQSRCRFLTTKKGKWECEAGSIKA